MMLHDTRLIPRRTSRHNECAGGPKNFAGEAGNVWNRHLGAGDHPPARILLFCGLQQITYSVKISRVLKEDDLDELAATARALLILGGTEDQYMLNPDYERRKRELENVANVLTDDVKKYWSQNNELRVQPDIT